jgi:hypothetical protein
MRASAHDISHTIKSVDCIMLSYDGYSSYLMIVDEATRYIWLFLTSSKDPPINIIKEFFHHHGHESCVRIDQGGKLARSHWFKDTLLRDFHYIVKPTGSDSPSQNGAIEIYNDKFGIRTCALLYGSGLPAKFWSSALLHLVYLHNQLVHSSTKKTPFQGYYGTKPDLSNLKIFGSRVCVCRSSKCRAKLDHHDFTGIFLGYAATNQNIIYLDLNSGMVKTSHQMKPGISNRHAYLRPSFFTTLGSNTLTTMITQQTCLPNNPPRPGHHFANPAMTSQTGLHPPHASKHPFPSGRPLFTAQLPPPPPMFMVVLLMIRLTPQMTPRHTTSLDLN